VVPVLVLVLVPVLVLAPVPVLVLAPVPALGPRASAPQRRAAEPLELYGDGRPSSTCAAEAARAG
jgi:hypothetical protein